MKSALTTRQLDGLDRLAVKIVSLVASRFRWDGKLHAYDGIEAAREIRALMVKHVTRIKKSGSLSR